MIAIKRAYDPASTSDGYRMLIDKLWPRGLTKDQIHIHEWNKNVAPSDELRKWFNHDPEKFEEFKTKYINELKKKHEQTHRLHLVARQKKKLTLIYGAKDTKHNHAIVLKQFVEKNEETQK